MKLNRYGFFLAAGLLSLPAFAIEAPSGATPPPPAPSGRPAETSMEDTPEEEPAQAPARPLAKPRTVAPATNSAYLGVGGYRAPEILAIHLGLKNGEGLVVSSLDPSGPAAAAGLAENDVITRADTTIVSGREDLTRAVQAKKPGDKISIDFIHEGKPDRRDIVLTTRPEGPVAGMSQQPSAPNAQLDRMLRNFPQEQADRIRESIEQRLRGDDIRPFQSESIPQMDDAIDEMRKRAEKMFEGMKDATEVESNFSSASSIRLLDDQGSVEIKTRNGGTEVRVLDKQGKEVWSGPWNSEQEKSAAPKDVRDRVDRLNFDMDSGNNGLRLRMGPKIDRR